jgi:hypothetical protein
MYKGSPTDYFRIERTIGDIQYMLREKYPNVYGKSTNLTMLHRHIDQLISEGLIERRKENFETHYRITSKGARYVVNGIYDEIEFIYMGIGGLKGTDEGFGDYFKLRKSVGLD